MAFETSFLELMTSSITVKAVASRSLYGGETVGSGTLVPAHVSYDTHMTRGDGADNSNPTAMLWCPPGGYVVPAGFTNAGTTVPTITANDHITLPSGQEHRVIDAVVRFDEDGVAHHQYVVVS